MSTDDAGVMTAQANPEAGRRGGASAPTLDEFVGQRVVRDQLGLVLKAAKARGRPPTTPSSPVLPASARRPSR